MCLPYHPYSSPFSNLPDEQRRDLETLCSRHSVKNQINTNYILACCGAASVTSQGGMASMALGGIILTHLQIINQH